MIESIEELHRKIQNGEQPSGGSPGQQQNPPLLPSSAELRLLRLCPQRVTRQTADFYDEHTDPADTDAEARGQVEQIARRQQEVAEMARKMNERMTGQ